MTCLFRTEDEVRVWTRAFRLYIAMSIQLTRKPPSWRKAGLAVRLRWWEKSLAMEELPTRPDLPKPRGRVNTISGV